MKHTNYNTDFCVGLAKQEAILYDLLSTLAMTTQGRRHHPCSEGA